MTSIRHHVAVRWFLSLVAFALLPLTIASQNAPDASAINKVIADRQSAWNAGDEQAYARLLTPDADISSATGRAARGREAVIQLYKEQRAGIYAGASTSTRVTHIRMIHGDVALVDADYELTGLRSSSVASRGRIVFVVAKQSDSRWLISAIRGIPGPIQDGR
jgi:uncharacterized protein (TIGR02246 family)